MELLTHTLTAPQVRSPRLRQKLSPLYPRWLKMVPNLCGCSLGYLEIIRLNPVVIL